MRTFKSSTSSTLILGALLLIAGSVGCGGGGGGTGGTAGTTSSVSGSVTDAAVSGATIQFYLNAALTSEIVPTNAPITTRADGSYGPATFSGTLPSQLFIKTTGGTDTGSGNPAPTLFGVSETLPSGTTSGTVSANALASLVVEFLQSGSSTPEEAYAQIATIFPGLPADPQAGLRAINVTSDALLTGETRDVANLIIAQSGTGTNAVQTFIEQLTSSNSTTRQNAINNLVTTNTNTNNTVTLNTDPTLYFAISQLTVGGQNVGVPTTLDTNGVAQFTAPANAINVAGTTPLPNVTITASNVQANGFRAGSVFPNATLTITIAGRGNDKRFFSIEVSKTRATINNDSSVSFAVDQGALFTFSGKDSNGNAVATIIADNKGADAVATTSGSTFTFNSNALINQLRARIGQSGFTSTHPAFLIGSNGSFDLSFTTRGIPFGLTRNTLGFATLQVQNVSISGQHDF